MCRRFALLYNIEQTSIDELYAYLYRLSRLYAIFLVIAIIELATNKSSNHALFLWALIGLLLYAVNVTALFYTSSHKDNRQFWHVSVPMCTATVLAIFNIANLINLITSEGNLWALFSLLSIILQITTVYLLWHLRAKMIAKENEKLMGGNNDFSSSSSAPPTPATAYNPEYMNRV